MINYLDTNKDGDYSAQEIYNWFTNNEATTDDVTLVNQFRTEMIKNN